MAKSEVKDTKHNTSSSFLHSVVEVPFFLNTPPVRTTRSSVALLWRKFPPSLDSAFRPIALSIDNTISILYTRLKGDCLVEVRTEVQYPMRTPGSSSTHSVFLHSSFFLRPCNIVQLVTSTCSFTRGASKEKWLWMPTLTPKDQNYSPSNCILLSVTRTLRTPNLNVILF